MSLPKTVYAVQHHEDGNNWVEASTDIEGFEPDMVIGEYKLVAKGKKQVTHSLETYKVVGNK